MHWSWDFIFEKDIFDKNICFFPALQLFLDQCPIYHILEDVIFLLDGDDRFTSQIFLDVEGNFFLPKGRNFLFKEFPQVWMSVLTSTLQTAALMKLWRKFYKESYTHRSQLIAQIIKQRTMWKFLFMQEIQKENQNLIGHNTL